MDSIALTIRKYEDFIEELTNFEISPGPQRPKFLSVVPSYPNPPLKEEIYSRKVFFDDLPVNRYLEKAYLIFENAQCVIKLVASSLPIENNEFIINYKENEVKTVRFHPWKLTDAQCIFNMNVVADERKTVFLSGIPYSFTAIELGSHVRSLFGSISFVAIHLDDELYPRGSAIVSFCSQLSQIQALVTGILNINNEERNQEVLVSQYFKWNQKCESCLTESIAVLFCVNPQCFEYFCIPCWARIHVPFTVFQNHVPYVKQSFKGTNCKIEA